jgi:hypothetical protein
MNTKIYNTHDNGGRPFKVVIFENNVKIYKNTDNSSLDNVTNNDILLFDLNPFDIFVGRSQFNKMTQFSGGYGNHFIGNSILLRLDNNTYQFIGDEIFTFTSLKEIIGFYSPVGNNDVPYPYAMDIDGNYYLMIENIMIINNNFIKETYKKYDNPYDYYYDYNLITPDCGFIPPKTPLIRKYEQFSEFNNIKEYYIGVEQYTLRYNPSSKDEEEQISIVDNNNNQQYLTNNEFKALHKRFGDTIGFHPLLNKNILVKRS